MAKPFLSTSRLELWPVSEADAPFASEIYSNGDMMKYLGGPKPADIGMQRMPGWLAQWKELGYGFCILKTKSGGERIGCAAIFPAEHDDEKHIEIGWMIQTPYQRKGFALEAASALVAYARKFHPDQAIVCFPGRDNVGSNRIPEKLGFKRLREASYPWLGVMLHTVYWRLGPSDEATLGDSPHSA